MKVPYYLHDLNEQDINSLIEVVKSPFLTTGEVTYKFEKAFAKLFKAKYAVGTTCWTSAAHLALQLWGIGPGDEVIVPTMSYCATAHVVSLCGATPIFIDSDQETGLMDLTKVEKAITKNTKAIIPVHLYGNMVDMKKIRSLRDQYHLKIFEDAAHAVICSKDGIFPGELSDAAAFSFYATKNITSGDGGIMITNDQEFAEKFRRNTRCGTDKSAHNRASKLGYIGYDSISIAGKCNMTNISASLLLSQMNRLQNNKLKRRELVNLYTQELEDVPNIRLPKITSDSSHSLFVILVEDRKDVFQMLAENDIGCAINYEPIHTLSIYKQLYGDLSFPIAEKWGQQCISLPLYPKLSAEEVKYVTDTLKTHYLTGSFKRR